MRRAIFSIVNIYNGKAISVAAYRSINQTEGTIEMGPTIHSPLLQSNIGY